MTPRPQRQHRPRARRTQSQGGRPSRAGERHEVVAGPIAHGGHVVARLPAVEERGTSTSKPGVVVFVRHALPGERVVVEITEGREGDSFLRGDAVEILEPSPHRVAAPCPYAGPGGCGGCDFQHVTLDHQRDLKTLVVREQLSRLAGLDVDVVVEAVPPDLGWRTRMQYVDLPNGSVSGKGLRKHRSHEVIEIDRCLIDASSVVEERGTSVSTPPSAEVSRQAPGRLPQPPGTVVERVEAASGAHDFAVASAGFWQPHVAAPQTLVDCVLDFLVPRPGESVVDLYAGVGLFAAFLADAVGEEGPVIAVEGDRAAAAHAAENAGMSVEADVQRWLERPDVEQRADLVVLDPPRTGAKRRVVDGIVGLHPRAVAYVACDPAALARDVAIFAEHGYSLTKLRAFDLFPMTHHVECVALLTRTGSDLR